MQPAAANFTCIGNMSMGLGYLVPSIANGEVVIQNQPHFVGDQQSPFVVWLRSELSCFGEEMQSKLNAISTFDVFPIVEDSA